VLCEANMLLKLLNSPLELFASICLEELLQAPVTKLPHILFGLSVLYDGETFVLKLVAQGRLCDDISSFSVLRVVEPRVISRLDAIARGEHSLAYVVKVHDLCGEPRYLRCPDYGHLRGEVFQILDRLVHMLIRYFALEVCVKLYLVLPVDHLCGP
jgi:hypothetical protein